MTLTLSRLINRPNPGNTPGRCYLCGENTTAGHPGPPSDSFTAWSAVYAGSVICPYCITLVRDRQFRSRSWLATTDTVRFAQPGEGRSWLLEAVRHPPDPPFALYLTRNGKKQGWLTLQRYVSTSRQQFWVGTDWTERPVLLTQQDIARWVPLLDHLRTTRGLRTMQLWTGQFPTTTWQAAIRDGWVEELEQIRTYVGDPRWEVLVYVTHQSDAGRGAGTDPAPGPDLCPDRPQQDQDQEAV